MANVTLRAVSKRYGEVEAVKGIDLDIAEGEFVVLLGPSGCGKTTTLRCIAGLEDISGGRITMGERVVSQAGRSLPPEQRNIGMVFQSYAVWPHLTVFENVAFGLKLKRLSAADIARRVQAALELVGLEGLAGRDISRLSGGQQQRVALARAVVLEPGVLLFDEPLSNLDAKLRERMRFELRQLQQRLGITSIYVTHDQQEAMVIADRVVLMHDGRIDQIGTPVELYRRPASLFGADFVGLANIWSGEVVEAGGATRLRLPGGVELLSGDTGFTVGETADVMCRPENLHFSVEPFDRANSFQARVTNITFLGNIADIYARIGELPLRGQLSPPRMWAEGTELWVHMPVEDVILFKRQDGQKLP